MVGFLISMTLFFTCIRPLGLEILSNMRNSLSYIQFLTINHFAWGSPTFRTSSLERVPYRFLRTVRLQLIWGTLVCRLRLKMSRRTPVTTKALQLTNSKK